MALQKQPVQINFAQGLDTKSDPKQVPIGKFADLQNSIFDKGGLLQKRNGYKKLTSLPDSLSTFSTTFNGNLTALGVNLYAYSEGSNTWFNKGVIQPLLLDTLPLIRSNTNQSQADSAIAPNGLICTVFTDNVPSGLSNVAVYKYVIADSSTGQNIIAPQVIPVSTGTVTGSPRVFLLGAYFVILITNNVSGTYHLQYIAISTNNPTNIGSEVDLSTQYTPATTVNFDGVVTNNSLYVAWNGSDGGGAVRATRLDSTLTQHNTISFPTYVADYMSVTSDETGSTPVVWITFYDATANVASTVAVNQNLVTINGPNGTLSSPDIVNITAVAQDMGITIYYEIQNFYPYGISPVQTDYITSNTVDELGNVSSLTPVVRSVGLASKAFLIDGNPYMLTVYSSPDQPSYFLINGDGQVISKLAYSNGSSYYLTGLPNVSVDGTTLSIPYLIKDFVTSANKDVGAAASSTIYSQLGINLVTMTIGTSDISTAEIGGNLNVSGGYVLAYDGYSPVEQGFNLWPDNILAAWSATGGSIVAKPDGATNTNAYAYQVTYEWSDNQGNNFKSAPSIPVFVTTTGSGSSGSVTLKVPTLRLTYKISNPVKIVIYRWSVAQQIFYQVTSITVPVLNSTTVDNITYVDTLADSSIIGNAILYTTGGVVENIGPPAASSLTLFKSRMFLVDAEDKNLLWYSKQVIEQTPVEMSDLFTIYVAPTTSAQGATGPITALSAMDDKLVIFKKNAIYYIVGNGPDNTGANNDFSEPVFITSTVGCNNQRSIIFMPQGIMFQSAKGIWLLGRDLSTTYIGAPVEDFNVFTVQSAVNVPGTNQVRFTLSNGVTLMYDYFYGQWGTFTGVPAVSSVIYQDLHTFINQYGEVYQETPNLYLDGSRPVNMSFKTGPINIAGLQGFERAYSFYFIGEYKTPHRLALSISYDYSPNAEQRSVVTPENFNLTYGGDPLYGSYTYGGNPSLEQWQVYLQRQKCQAFQIELQEIYDSSFGVPAGAGLTLSGLNITVGVKDTKPRLKASVSIG